jgi:hypothetical protein
MYFFFLSFSCSLKLTSLIANCWIMWLKLYWEREREKRREGKIHCWCAAVQIGDIILFINLYIFAATSSASFEDPGMFIRCLFPDNHVWKGFDYKRLLRCLVGFSVVVIMGRLGLHFTVIVCTFRLLYYYHSVMDYITVSIIKARSVWFFEICWCFLAARY